MGLDLGGIGNLFKNIPGLNMISTAMDLVQGVMSGDLNKILSSVSQLALTYATGGAGALFGQLAPVVQNVGSDLMAKVLTGAMSVETALATIQMIGDQMGLGQNDIDAAQGAFAEAVGEKGLARTNYREAGFNEKGSDGDRRNWFGGYRGNSVTDAEKGGARELLGAILAGPNPTPVGVGQSQQQANTMMGALMNAMLSFAMGFSAGQGTAGNPQADNASGGSFGGGFQNDQLGSAADDDRRAQNGGGVAIPAGASQLMKIAIALGTAIDEKMDDMEDKSMELSGMADGKEDKTGDKQIKYGVASAELTALGQEMKIIQEALNNTLKSIGEASSGLARKN